MGVEREQCSYNHHRRKMKFPVSFTLVFLSVSWVNALDFPGSFAPGPDLDTNRGVSRPYNRTLLSGTAGVGIVPVGCTIGCAKVCPPLLPCNKTRRTKMCCAPTYRRGKPSCARVGTCHPLN